MITFAVGYTVSYWALGGLVDFFRGFSRKKKLTRHLENLWDNSFTTHAERDRIIELAIKFNQAREADMVVSSYPLKWQAWFLSKVVSKAVVRR